MRVNLNIRFKLLSAYIAVMFFTGVVGIIGFSATNTMNNLIGDMFKNNLTPIRLVSSADEQSLLYTKAVRDYII
jgi:hypothetical protein